MRPILALLTLFSAIALVGGVGFVSSTVEAKPKALTVVVADRAPTYGDPNPAGPGSMLLFDEPLLDPATGNQTGTSKTPSR